MHDLLRLEEMAQHVNTSRYNVETSLQLMEKYLITSNTNSSTAKFARPGEAFGVMKLGNVLSEDTPAGRLILTNCSTLLLKPKAKDDGGRAYVAQIEDTGKSALYLRLSSRLVSDHDLRDKMAQEDEVAFEVEVQFQLNRMPIVEMHSAVDKLPDISLVYPDVKKDVAIPWTPSR